MKKFISIAALTVLAITMMADTSQTTGTTVGNTANTGAHTASNLNPEFLGQNPGAPTPEFSFNSTEQIIPFQFTINTDQALLGVVVNSNSGSTGYAALPIYGFSLSCAPYNATLVGGSGYPYTAETNGIAGGTVTVTEYKPTGAAVNLGTLVLPTSPRGGPYINTAKSSLPAAYTPTAGSVLSAWVSVVNPTPTNYYQYCAVNAVLQAVTVQP